MTTYRTFVVVNPTKLIVKTTQSIEEYEANSRGELSWIASVFPNAPRGRLLDTKARPFLYDHPTVLSATQLGGLVVIKKFDDTWIPSNEIEMPRGLEGMSCSFLNVLVLSSS